MKLPQSLLVLPAVFLLAACGSGDSDTEPSEGSAGSAESASPEAGEADEYTTKVTSCGVSEGIIFAADVDVTNDSGDTHSYVINVGVKNADGTVVGQANGTTEDIAPGKTATSETITQVTDALRGKGISCEVIGVTVD